MRAMIDAIGATPDAGMRRKLALVAIGALLIAGCSLLNTVDDAVKDAALPGSLEGNEAGLGGSRAEEPARSPGTVDASIPSEMDAGHPQAAHKSPLTDPGTDAGAQHEPKIPTAGDAGHDAGHDAGDAGHDAGDAGHDAGHDAGDAGRDAGDAGHSAGDAGHDAATAGDDGGGEICDDDAGSCPKPNLCTPGVSVCSGLAQCLKREGRYRCACPSYYDDVHGDGSQCVDTRFLSVAAYGGANANLGLGIDKDANGNIVWAGGFQDQIWFGALPKHSTAGDYDVFVVEFDPAFNPLWSRSFGSSGDDRAIRVVADVKGDVEIAGMITDVVTMDGISLGSQGTSSCFVAKLSGADGAVIWARPLPAADWYDPFEGWVWDVETDASGNIYTAGRFSGSYDFGTPGGPAQATGPADAFVAKFDANGIPLWVHTLAAQGTSAGLALAIDGHGNVILTGLVEGSAAFDSGPQDGYGGQDAFLMKLSPDGKRLWSTRYGGAGNDYGIALAIGPNDDIFASGAYGRSLTWGNESRPMGSGISDYLARLDSDGNLIWLAGIDTQDAVSRNQSLIAMPDGLAMTGAFESTLGFEDGTTLKTAGVKDMFVARFANDGAPLWAQSFGGTNYDEAVGVVLGASGELVVTGWFAGPVVFAGHDTPTVGWLGAMLLRLKP